MILKSSKDKNLFAVKNCLHKFEKERTSNGTHPRDSHLSCKDDARLRRHLPREWLYGRIAPCENWVLSCKPGNAPMKKRFNASRNIWKEITGELPSRGNERRHSKARGTRQAFPCAQGIHPLIPGIYFNDSSR
jgi:hypothetical protein